MVFYQNFFVQLISNTSSYDVFFQNVQEMEHQINSSEMLQNLSSSLEYEKWKPMKQTADVMYKF